MSPASRQLALLAAGTLLWAGCASQKTQTLDRPPTSNPLHGLEEGEATLHIAELDAIPDGRDLQSVHTTSQETLLVVGLPGVSGDPGLSDPRTPPPGLPVFPSGNEENLPTPAFPDAIAGPHALDAPRAPEVAATGTDLPSQPPENLAEPEFAGPQGIAGGPDALLTETQSPANPSAGPDSEEPPGNLAGSAPLFPEVPTALEPSGDPNEHKPGQAWPWQLPNSLGEEEGDPDAGRTLEDLLSWLNNQDSTRPDDAGGLLDDFRNPGDALAWLLNRTAPGNGSANPDDARKQAAVLDWLSRLQKVDGPDAEAPGGPPDLRNVLDWFQRGGGADAEAPGQDDLTGATRQLAQWLGHAAQVNAGDEGPSGQSGAGSNAMLKWLSQGRGVRPQQDTGAPSGKPFAFPFKPAGSVPADGEVLSEPRGPAGSFSMPSHGATTAGQPVQSRKPQILKSRAHGWLQAGSVSSSGPSGPRASAADASSMDYSAAFGWLRRAATSRRGKSSSTAAVPRVNMSAPALSSLAPPGSMSEALRWFQKGNGQLKHRLHAARREESGTHSATTP